MSRIGRNSVCPCGSGRKYKRCCGSAEIALRLNDANLALQKAQRVAQLAPADADARCALADAYMALKRPADAIEELAAGWRFRPGTNSIGTRLIAALMREGRLDEGIMYFREMLARAPGLASDYAHLAPSLAAIAVNGQKAAASPAESMIDARVHLACNAFGYAINCLGNKAPLARACRGGEMLDRTCASVYIALFEELLRHHRYDDALLCARALDAVEPENRMAKHLIAALNGTPLERASPEYCEELFDRFALRFDDQLINQLQYTVPRKLAELMQSLVNRRRGLDILDLGCGTGLIGSAFAIVAKALIGVDLSSAMLEQAKKRNVYTRLEKADILDFLEREPNRTFDLVVAGEVFVYLGRLDSVFDGMYRLLRYGGFALFSIEALEAAEVAQSSVDSGYALAVNGRFAHSRSYIEALAARYAFSIERSIDTTLRTEHGKPVSGRLYALKREEAPSPNG